MPDNAEGERMRARVDVKMNNPAFDQEEGRPELARILAKLASNLADDPSRHFVLRDFNGNPVGECRITGVRLKP